MISLLAVKKSQIRGAKPFLKWVGGKGQLLAQLAPLFPKNFKKYFEPFLGGGAVFFWLRPKHATLNDINETLITAYAAVRDNAPEVMAQLRKLERNFLRQSPEGRVSTYYKHREHYNSLPSDSFQRACLFLFLNRTAFNGVYRENSQGRFNVPMGKYLNPKILDEENLQLASKTLAKAKTSSTSFEEAVAGAKAGDFVYFDPPYYPLSKTASFTSYSKDSFSEKDQIRLRDLFIKLNERGAYVMLSNSNTAFIREAYAGFRQIPLKANRMVNSKKERRGKITEIVVLNYDPENL